MILSVIIPTFNSQLTIVRAIKSCIVNKMSNIEILMIDDGSTDSTVEIVRNSFSSLVKNNTLKIIRTHHGGAGRSRNTGLKVAQGEWVIFLDSDDEFYRLDDVLNDLVSNNSNNVDIFNYFNNDKLPQALHLVNGKSYIKENLGIYSYEQWNSRPSHKVYRYGFLKKNNIFFPTDIKVGEDLVFNLECLMQQPLILTRNNLMYKINVNNKSSITHTILQQDIYEDTVKLVDTVSKFPLTKSCLNEFKAKSFAMMIVRYLKSQYSIDTVVSSMYQYMDKYPIDNSVVAFYRLRKVLGTANTTFFLTIWEIPSLLKISFNIIRQKKYR